MDNHIFPGLEVDSGSEPVWQADPVSLGVSTFLAGCNIYHTRSVLRQRVYFRGKAKENGGHASPELKAAFMRRFLALPRFAPTHGDANTIKERLSSRDDVSIADILMEALLAVEAAAASAMRRIDAIKFAIVDKHLDHTDLIWETAYAKMSRRAMEVAFLGVLDLLQNPERKSNGSQSEFDSVLAALLKSARQNRTTHTTSLMKYVAEDRGLPAKIFNKDQIRIGHGRAQRLLVSSMPHTTSAAAHKFCWDKRVANRRMMELRLPVPRHLRVPSVEAAREAAEKLGYPIVVKPMMGSGGHGVTTRITSPDEIEAAFLHARRSAPDVLVEEYVPGDLYRLLVIDGRFAGALRCLPPVVVGDGKKTVQQLIDELNADPLRDGIIMTKVNYDDEMERLLGEHGLTLDSVVAEGMTCPLRLVANVGFGASSEDCTDQVHEANRELAERAARGFDLEVAGIDLITPDISRSYREVGGRIIELNTRPGLLMHMWPAYGQSRNFVGRVLDQVFPSSTDGRIPIVVVAGDRGTGTTARILDQLLRDCGKSTGLTLREVAYVNGEAVDVPLEKKRLALTALLSDPEVEVLVSAISLRRAVQRGMELDTCSVAIILDRNKEGNADQFQAGVSVVERATTEVFVVGIGNQIALQHLEILGKRRLILVGNRITDPLVQQHLARGDTVIADGWADEDDRIVLMTGEQKIAHFPVNEAWARLTKGQQRKLRRASRYAIAAAFAVGLPVTEIETAIMRLDAA